MKKIHKTKLCPFDFNDWCFTNIKNLFAGTSCVMAITADGKVLQKVENKDLAARTEYWKNIKSISISSCFPALAVGLVEDGTCMVSKRALRHCCSITRSNFDLINDKIKSLKNIVEIAVSDAIFALDSSGRVHYIPLCRDNVYRGVESWKNIFHIAVGSQDSVFGLTKDGSIVCTGHNCMNGPHGNAQEQLSRFNDVIDICALGSECENIILALSNGKVIEYRGNDLQIEHCGQYPVFYNDFPLAVVRAKDDKVKCIQYYYIDGIEQIEKESIDFMAVGTNDDYRPFAVWCRK